ncbi:hypothetical protein GCM10010483_35420 [Actinokineospora diospyrosa]
MADLGTVTENEPLVLPFVATVGMVVSDVEKVSVRHSPTTPRPHVIVKVVPARPEDGLALNVTNGGGTAADESGAKATNNVAVATAMLAKRPTLRTARTPVRITDLVERPGPIPDRCSIPPRSALPQPGVFPWDVSSPPRLLS